jgi:hypothetical protein
VEVHRIVEAGLGDRIERIADLHRAGPSRRVALRTELGVAENPGRDIEAEPVENVAVGRAGLLDARIEPSNLGAHRCELGVIVALQ